MSKVYRIGSHSRRRRRDRSPNVPVRRGSLAARHRSRALRFEPLEDRLLLTGDALVRVSFEFLDPDTGTSLPSLQPSDEFLLNVNIQDLRDGPTGIYQAYLDIQYNPTLVQVDGALDHTPQYTLLTSGNTSAPGLIDAAGGFSSGQPSPSDAPFRLFGLPFRVLPGASGQLSLTSDLDGGMFHELEFYPSSDPVTLEEIEFVNATIDIVPSNAALLAISATDAAKAEGNAGNTAFTFTVTRAGVITQATTVDYTVAGSGASAANAADFGGALSSGQVSFAAGETSKTITVNVSGDTTLESSEEFSVTLTNPSGGALITTAAAGGIIQNDDVALALAATSADKAEGNTGSTPFTFSVTRTGLSTGATSVAYTVTGSGASPANAADFGDALPGGLVSFATGETTKTITVNVTGDTSLESDESFTVTLSNASGGSQITTATAGGTIRNDDVALTIAAVDADKAEGNAGSTTFTFSVTRTGVTTGAVTADYAVTGSGTSAAGAADFGGALPGGQVSFAAGQTSQTITVNVTGDAAVEPDEGFSVTLSNASGGAQITTSTANGTIRNDDSATLTLSGVDASRNEDAGGLVTNFTFDATLSAAVQGGFDVGYATADHTATVADDDYEQNSGTLHFAGTAGETQRITVQVNPDSKVERDEVFRVALGSLSNIAAGLTSRITVVTTPVDGTIQNDDVATLTLSPPAPTPEGTGGGTTAFAFEIALSAEVQGGLTVNYATSDGTARVADNDYVAAIGALGFTGTAGEKKTVVVQVKQDAMAEQNETFEVALGALTEIDPSLQAWISIEGSPAAATILDDDVPRLTLSPAAVSHDEGNGGGTTAYAFNVTLTGDVADADGFDVAYTTNDDTAAAGSDYQDNDGSLHFAGLAGETRTITVLVNRDDAVETNETFTVMLGQVSGLDSGLTVEADSIPATGTIVNDDSATLSLAGVNAARAEGTGGSTTGFTFEVTLSHAVEGGFQIDYTTQDGTATVADDDYAASDGTLTFDGAADEKYTITVPVLHDAKVEFDESFRVVLGAISNINTALAGAVTVANTEASGTVVNDDTTTLTLSTASAAKDEGTGGAGTDFTFQVTLSDAVDGGFRVPYRTIDGTATADDGDYQAVDDALQFTGAAGESRTITVRAGHDAKVEADETFRVVLDALLDIDPTLAANISLADTPLDATIVNDDAATLTLSGPASGDEGTGDGFADFVFTLTLSAEVQGGLGVMYATIDGTATAGEDYTDKDGTLTFTGTANETQTITVAVRQDDLGETDETFQVSVVSLLGLEPTAQDDIEIEGSPATFTILDDDLPRLILRPATVSHNEGAGGTGTDYLFTVTLSSDVLDPDGFSVAYATQDGMATVAGNDYETLDGVLHFDGTAGETRTVTVRVNGDDVVEADETFFLVLGEISGLDDSLTVIGEGGTAAGTIVNDDTASLTLAGELVVQDEGTEGTTTDFVFTVTLSDAVQGGLGVTFATEDGTATTEDDDYVALAGTLEFDGTVGETQTITVQVKQDSKVELDEIFRLALDSLVNLHPTAADDITLSGSPREATIRNDDSATLSLTGVSAASVEGTGGTSTDFTFQVTLSHDVQGGFSLAYTTDDGTASAGDGDYTDNDGSLTFAGTAGESKTITVRVGHDAKVEADETFQVALRALADIDPVLAESIDVADAPEQGTIINDDRAVLLLSAPSPIEEGTDGDFTDFVFEVTLSADVQGGLTASFTTDDGSATVANGDYVDNDGQLQFTGTAGETKTIVVQVVHDERTELNETFSVSLGAPTGILPSIGDDITVEGSPASATIINDDVPRLRLRPVSVALAEGTDGETTEFVFTVTLSDDLPDPDGFDVTYATSDGTATVAGGDYGEAAGTLHFEGFADETKKIAVLVAGDGIVEASETFSLSLVEITNLDIDGPLLIDGSPATGTILNDDQATLTLAAEPVSQDEGTSGQTTAYAFQVALSGDVQDGFDVAYRTDDGTATAGDGDYIDNDGVLQFAGTSGETRTITVLVRHDDKVEIDEVFRVVLGDLLNLDAAAADAITVVGGPVEGTIRNDDVTTLTLAPVSRAEGTGVATTEYVFDVTLSHPVQGGLSVAYTTQDDTATTAGGDYLAADGTLIFSGTADETQAITVQVNADAKVERDEVFQVLLGELSGLLDPSLAGQITIVGSPAAGAITNDDTATISFVSSFSEVFEADGSHSVDVRLTVSNGGTLSEAVTVSVTDWETGTANTPDDYTLDESEVVFEAGSGDGDTRSVTFTLVSDDAPLEDNETVNLGLDLAGDGIGGYVSLGTPGEHTVEIVDDPQDAEIRGFVFVDSTGADGGPDGQFDGQEEVGIPCVIVRLVGTDRNGNAIELVAMTDSSGSFGFIDLPSGTYALYEDHPSAFIDGDDSAGSGGGEVQDDGILNIQLEPSEVYVNAAFGERGLRARYVSRRMFLASASASDVYLRGVNQRAAEQEADSELADSIETGSIESEVSAKSVTAASEAERDGTGGEGESPRVGYVPLSSPMVIESQHSAEGEAASDSSSLDEPAFNPGPAEGEAGSESASQGDPPPVPASSDAFFASFGVCRDTYASTTVGNISLGGLDNQRDGSNDDVLSRLNGNLDSEPHGTVLPGPHPQPSADESEFADPCDMELELAIDRIVAEQSLSSLDTTLP